MPLSLLIKLSLRNLTRYRRRNAMMLLAVAIAVGGVVFMNTFIRGMQQDMADSAVANLTGHIKILAAGYREDPNISKSFEIAEDWEPEIAAAQLAGWAGRIRVPAVIMSERETRGIQLVGVDPAQEGISFLSTADYEGSELTGVADKRVVIGKTLAEQLDTKVGRRLVIITQGADGLNREAGFRIAGVYDAEGTSLEKIYVFTGLEHIQRLVGADVVTEVSIRLNEEPKSFEVKKALTNFFTGMEVRNWQELEPQAAAMFVFAESAIFIWFFIMMGALIFGLVNTLIAAVMERIKELGMLRAIGMRRGAVLTQVVIESSVLMILGTLLGIGLGVFGYSLIADGIDLSRWAEGMEMVGASSVMVPKLLQSDLVLVGSMSIGFGILASLYPAWRAVKIEPLDALGR